MAYWKSNYRYTPLLARFIESCFRNEVITIKDLASSLGISVSYAYYLLRKLKSDLNFTIRAVPYYKKIGLTPLRCILTVESAMAKNFLFDLLSKHDYTSYISMCTGKVRGLYCEILVPKGREDELLMFLEFSLNYGIINDYMVSTVSSLRNIVLGFEWYDFSNDTWRFNWQSLLNELLLNADKDVSISSEEEDALSNVKFDDIDLIILHHMESDIFTTLKSMATQAKVTSQDLSYHYKNHVLKNKLINLVRPYWIPYPLEYSLFYVMDIVFEKTKALKGFIYSLQRKPLAYSFSFHEHNTHPSITLTGILPYKEIINFMNCLDSLKDHGIVRDYAHYILDTEKSKGKALPYWSYSDELGWLYSMDSCVKKISEFVGLHHEGKTKFAKAAERAIESK